MQRQHDPLSAALAGVSPADHKGSRWRRLDGNCASSCVDDLGSLLADASTLQQLVAALFLPFEQMHVDQVVALHVVDAQDPPVRRMPTRQSAAEKKKRQQERAEDDSFPDPPTTVHQFTSAVAGAVAGANHLAFGEMTARRSSRSNGTSLKKRQRSGANPDGKMTVQTRVPRGVATVEAGNCGLAGVDRQTIATTARVLLVIDWIDEVDSILAARAAISRLGGDVVGVPFSCWSTPDVEAEPEDLSSGSESLGSEPSKALHSTQDSVVENSGKCCPRVGCDWKPRVFLSHHTAQYQANFPGEDRSVNVVKTTDEGIQVNAVFDGHGGSRAVEFIRDSLCQRIVAEASRETASEEVAKMLRSAFIRCDEELKESLMALSPETRMSKGYCNAGSCAVVALFIGTTLYVANVGDCAAVVGRTSMETGGLQAIEVSVEHSCNNPEEVCLVIERSRDRNPVRLSKDDQANAGFGGFGVKRVAGSLAVTRALGDFYLKCEELSSAPFKNKVPYITAEPSIATFHMNGSEKYVILASDGLWEVMTPQEAVHIVDKFDPGQCLFFSTAGAALIHAALEKIAHRDGMMLHELMAKPRGPERRRFHDDITCTVVYIHPEQGSHQGQVETVQPQEDPTV